MRSHLDPAWLESQYNNRALVPDHAAVMGKWTTASQLVLRQGSAQLDVPYGSGEGETLDIFAPQATPDASPGAPVMVFIHGGYWRALDKSDHAFVAPAFNAAGALVVVPNYALCPAVSIEHICLQMARALLWVWHNAARLGGDPARIMVVGHSAGAHLAAMLLSCRWKELDSAAPAQLLTGALCISGLYDLEPLRHTPFLNQDLQLTPQSVARLSPAFFPRPKAGKLYATVGLDESSEFHRQTRLIREVWGPTAVPVCETVPRANHFTVLTLLVDPSSRMHLLALRLLGLAP
jgi:arylformamidase